MVRKLKWIENWKPTLGIIVFRSFKPIVNFNFIFKWKLLFQFYPIFYCSKLKSNNKSNKKINQLTNYFGQNRGWNISDLCYKLRRGYFDGLFTKGTEARPTV